MNLGNDGAVLPASIGVHQAGFNSGRRSEHRVGQSQPAECAIESRLCREPSCALPAIRDVTQAGLAIAGIHNFAAHKLYDNLFKVFAVHTRHPAGLTR
jgi:hypothetical protein